MRLAASGCCHSKASDFLKESGNPMVFQSILFKPDEDGVTKEAVEAPSFFVDLNLDQIINAITAGKQEYDLAPFFYTPLHDIDAIWYRHEIFRDLENKNLFECIQSFTKKMRIMREHLAQAEKLYYRSQRKSWFLDAVGIYCDAVTSLAHDLSLIDMKARGFLAFRAYLANYAGSDRFTSLLAETKQLKADLATVRYCLLIQNNRITVRKYENEIDYSADVEQTFAKFKQGAVNDYKVTFPDSPEMNHVEAKILDLVAQLYPDIFSRS